MPALASFGGSLVLGRPTATSIAINAVSDANAAAYVEYGLATGVYSHQTGITNLSAGQPVEVVLTGLQPNARYFYRLRFEYAGATTFEADVEHTFHTQRPPGSTFTFCIQGDSHPERVGKMFDFQLYSNTLVHGAADQPDFYMTIGDDFSVDLIPTNSLNSSNVTYRYVLQRPYLSLIGNSAPVFLVNGNHEQAAAYLLNGTSNSVAVWAQNARNSYYSEPAPDGFYTGNTNSVPFIGLLRNYYAWTWGDALFITLDPYWASPICVDNVLGDDHTSGAKRTNIWDVTHGDAQYQWLKTTLEQSQARYKFVFAHHVLGTGRGGIEEAFDYEWGGYNVGGNQIGTNITTWGFATNRPLWAMPIHQLMASNHCTIFFQGHDHLFAHQQLDGVTYQELPLPADPSNTLYNADAYLTGYVTNSSGYTRVTVSPAQVKVEYVRMYLPAAETNGQYSGLIGHSYVIASPQINAITASNSQAQLLLNGTLFQNHALQASTNLAGWTTILNTNLTVTPILWADPGSTNYRRRFYRFGYGL